MERLGALLKRVRVAPLTGRTRDADGRVVAVRVDTRVLADLVQDSASDPVTLRELDASVTAALAGDDVPLLRLAGAVGHLEPHADRRGVLLARRVPGGQLHRPAAALRPRRVAAATRAQLATASPPAGAFAPFTGAEWLTVSGFSQPYDVCLDWPAPVRRPPRLPSVEVPVPILIVGGDLDSLTPLLDAPVFGPRLGSDVRIVTLPNTVHVTSQGGDFLAEGMRCARWVIRSFVRGALDDACAATIPALHVPSYPATLAAATPATLVSGADPGESARRAATVARTGVRGRGLPALLLGRRRRAGPARRHVHGQGRHVSRCAASASSPTRASTARGRGWRLHGAASATLTVAGVTVNVSWTQRTPLATARIGGALMTLPAP